MSTEGIKKRDSAKTDLAKSAAPADTPPPESSPGVAKGAVTAVDPRLVVREQGFAGYLTEFKRRMRGGELGSVPVIVGLILIMAIFQGLDDAFLSAQNLSNISIDIAGPGLIAVGIIFVLLLGEIDLSIGSVSGLAGAVFAVLAVQEGMPEVPAIILAILVGTATGTFHGFFFARIGVPPLVVTLAGLLGWQGLMLYILGSSGTINIDSDGVVGKLTTYYFTDVAAAYGVATIAVGGYFAAAFFGARRREAAGVPSRPLSEIILRTAVLAVLAYVPAYVLNQYKGLPLALLIFLIVVVGADFTLRRTGFGRRIFALGGSVEASRRAGIDVDLMRIAVFAVSGTLAAVGGLFMTSTIAAANQGAGGGTLLMNAIAAAVIGGTSLYGGRGSSWSALLGVLVIMSIQSGLALKGIDAPVQYMITGSVLLAAVVIDSVSRRTQKTAGRA
ncbi:sugar ABC transporter permease [Streptomyces sp. NPDC004134]|uniref:sugar ABC transporter permease n=1 Tax=Streptomyces sp. NPDC004134 TaxID=3364691 RepID=UPI0036C21BBE